MTKDFSKVIIVFISLFIIFVAAVTVSEIVNYNHIIKTYPQSGQIAVPDTVRVTMPTQAAFDFHKSKIITWLIRLFLSFAVPAFYIFKTVNSY